MPWPHSQDYNEAVQSPASSFNDFELKLGQVGTNPLGIPLPHSGNFADVYEIRCPYGSRWAVKCFTREVPGLRERYQEISNHLRQVQLPFMVDFTFLEQGIRIGGRWYPILKMQWVEGLPLNEFVRQYADKPAMLDAVLQIWVRMARRLWDAGIAHGDLQHGNLLLVPSAGNSLAVKLIDYDGMFVPALAGRRSDEVGHPSYQHPRRLRERTYSREVDRFPLLLIATALHCLKVGGRALWEKYDNGDNLLFREADLQTPVKSRLFYELLKLPDPVARKLVEQTLEGLKERLETIPLLDELLSEPAPAAHAPAARQTITATPARKTGVDTSGKAETGEEASSGTAKRPAHTRTAKKRGRLVVLALGAAAAVVLAGGVIGWALGRASPEFAGAPLNEKGDQGARNDLGAPPNGKQPVASGNDSISKEELPPPPVQDEPKHSDDPPKQNKPADKPVSERFGDNAVAKPENPPSADQKPKVRELFTCSGRHDGPVRALCISKDGKRAVSLGVDNNIRLWNLDERRWIQKLESSQAGELIALALCPDGKRVLTAGKNKTLHLFELEKGKVSTRVYNGHTDAVNSVDISPDGTRAISGGDDKSVHVWDIEKGTEIRSWTGHKTAITLVRFSADGKRAVTCSRDGMVGVWDVGRGAALITLVPSNKMAEAVSAALSPDGDLLALGIVDATASLWHSKKQAQIARLPGHRGPVHTVAFSPDGRYIITASGDDKSASTFLWLLADDGQPSRITLQTGSVTPMALVFTPDGRHVIAGYRDGTIRGWEISGGPPMPPKVIAHDPIVEKPPVKPADPVVENPPVKSPAPVVEKPPMKPVEPVVEKPPVKPPERPPVTEKTSVPDEAALAEAIEEIKETFKEDYSKLQTNKAAQALAAKLIETAQQTKDSRIKRFALYREARDLAARAAAPSVSLQAVEAMAKEYPLNLLEAKVTALQLVGKSLANPVSAKAFLEAALPLLKEARATDHYAPVAPLISLARQAVQVARDPALTKATDPFLIGMEHLRKRYETVKPAVQTLKDKPDDPDANRIVGGFLCLDKQEWDKGLPLLSKTSDSALAAVAQKELGKPADPADQAAVGDAWFELAKAHPEFRSSMQKRAYRWYAKSLLELSGKDKERVEKRVMEMTRLHSELRTAWDHLDLAGAKATVVGDTYLRVSAGHVLSTKKAVAGPIEITVVLRTTKKPPRFEFLVAKDIRVIWENTDKLLVVRRPANQAKGLLANLNVATPFNFAPNDWYTFTCRMTDGGMDISVNGVPVFRDPSKYNLPRTQTIQVGATEEALEIRSFTVKPIQP